MRTVGSRCELVLYKDVGHAFFAKPPLKYFIETTLEIDLFLNLTDKIILITDIKNIKNIILLHNTSEKLEPKKNFLADPRFDLQIKNCEIMLFSKFINDEKIVPKKIYNTT